MAYFLFYFFGIEEFTITGLIKNTLPITLGNYWFVTAFVVVYVLAPYINVLLNSLDRKMHFRLILVLLVLFSILPTLTTQLFFGNELVELVVFYVIGAYFGKYKNSFFSKKKNCWFVLFGGVSAIVISVIILDLLGTHWPAFSGHSRYFLSRNSIVSIAIAVSVFSLFIQKKSFTNPFINTIAGCAFGVYLISDNSYIRNWLWSSVLNVPAFSDSPILILHLFGSVLVVYCFLRVD